MKTAIILAAGSGRKLWPLSDTHPKSILPIATTPLICKWMTDLKGLGIERLWISAGDHSPAIERALGEISGVEVIPEASPDGPAWSVRQIIQSRKIEEDLLIVHSDMLLDRSDLEMLIASSTSAALISPLDPRHIDPLLPEENSQDWITAALEGDGFKRFLGHYREPQSCRSAGAFVFAAADLDVFERPGQRFEGVQVGSMPPNEVPIEQAMNDLVDNGKPVRAVKAKHPVIDIDKPFHYLLANDLAVRLQSESMAERVVGEECIIDPLSRINGKLRLGNRCRIEGPVLIDGDVVAGDDVVIADGAIVRGPLVIGDRSILRDYCHITGPSAIGADSVIGHAAEFQGVIMDHVYLYHFMEIFGALGSCVDIGAGTVCGTLRFDDRPQPQTIQGRREIPNSYANAVTVGAYSRTGVNVSLLPGVKVGSYSVVGPGTIVTEDIPSNTGVHVEQALKTRPWGPEKHGW